MFSLATFWENYPGGREKYGRIVRDAWVKAQKERHPERVYPDWEQLSEEERETDMRIAETVVVEYWRNTRGC